MEINQIDNASLKDLPTGTSCDINCLHIKIKDFKPIVQEFETYISDTSWINSLDEISKKAFKVNAEKTIDKIVNDIIGKITFHFIQRFLFQKRPDKEPERESENQKNYK